MASKPFEIHVTLDAPELAQAISSLSLAIRDCIPAFRNGSNGSEVVVPAGAKMTVQDVQPAPAPVQQAAPISAAPAPVQQPVTAPPAPQPMQTAAPAPVTTPPVPQVAPIPAAPVPVQQPVAAPPVPQAGAPSNVVQFPRPPQAQGATQGGVTLDAIITAGASLVEKGMMAQVISLLTKYNVPTVNQLQPAQFEPFAAELRSLGAPI